MHASLWSRARGHAGRIQVVSLLVLAGSLACGGPGPAKERGDAVATSHSLADAEGDGAGHDDDGHGEDGSEADGHSHETGSLSAHIHMIDFWGDDNEEIAIATHTGVYRTQAGSSALVKVGGDADFMGFVRDPFHPNTYWGSGHSEDPGLGLWGFVESKDSGKTWKPKSLIGKSDFHQMDASPTVENLVGGVFGGKLWWSVDAGLTWQSQPWAKSTTGLLFESATSVLLGSADGIERVSLPSMKATTLTTARVTGLCRRGKGILFGTFARKMMMCDANAADCQVLIVPTSATIVQCLVDPDEPTRMFILASGSKLFHSDDDGATWETIAAMQ